MPKPFSLAMKEVHRVSNCPRADESLCAYTSGKPRGKITDVIGASFRGWRGGSRFRVSGPPPMCRVLAADFRGVLPCPQLAHQCPVSLGGRRRQCGTVSGHCGCAKAKALTERP